MIQQVIHWIINRFWIAVNEGMQAYLGKNIECPIFCVLFIKSLVDILIYWEEARAFIGGEDAIASAKDFTRILENKLEKFQVRG